MLRPTARLALLAIAAAVAACGRSETRSSDTSAGNVAAAAAPSAGAADSAMSATADAATMTDSAHMASMAQKYGAPKDADQEFMRMMSDHHQGLVAMLEPAPDRAMSAEAKSDARKLHDEQASERDRIVAMLKSGYGESYAPMVMPSNQPMVDTLSRTTGAEFDHRMYHEVVAHHRQGVQMIDQYLPRLKNPELRSMTQKMRSMQQREIAEYEKKATART